MTRREFIYKLTAFAAAAIVGFRWFAKKAVPRKFVWAAGLKKYPGSLRPLPDIQKQGKWSG
jgi:hypothetical protein